MNGKRSGTALLIIDFINLFDFEGAQRLAPRALRAAKRTARLKSIARRERLPCIYANDNFGRWTSEFLELTKECAKREGVAGEIVNVLRPERGDLSVLKPRHSAFYDTPLEFLLDELRVDKLVITGITADICVFATAQDAYVRKFKVWVPSDCVASFSQEYERTTLAHMARTLKAYTGAARNRKDLAWRGERASGRSR